MVRTRTAAAALVTGGHVRVNGERIDASSRSVRPGDVVTVALDRTVRVLKVTGFAERRGGAEAAAALYEDLNTPAGPRIPGPGIEVPQREPGSGRPTKQERRALDRLRREPGD